MCFWEIFLRIYVLYFVSVEFIFFWYLFLFVKGFLLKVFIFFCFRGFFGGGSMYSFNMGS